MPRLEIFLVFVAVFMPAWMKAFGEMLIFV